MTTLTTCTLLRGASRVRPRFERMSATDVASRLVSADRMYCVLGLVPEVVSSLTLQS